MHSQVFINARAAISRGTFTMLAYRGGPLRLNGWDLPVVVDLRGLVPAKVMVANLDHNGEKRVGNVTEVENNGRELRLGGALNAATEWRDEVLESHRNGFVWQASVEVAPDDVEEIEPHQQVIVNGRAVTGPVYVTRTGELMGVAFVSHGADRGTEVSIAASRPYLPEPEFQMFDSKAISRIASWIQ